MIWHRIFIALRNRIGDMEYDEGGAIGYYWSTPMWRRAIADCFDWIAYHGSPVAMWWRIRSLANRLRNLAPDDDPSELPF